MGPIKTWLWDVGDLVECTDENCQWTNYGDYGVIIKDDGDAQPLILWENPKRIRTPEEEDRGIPINAWYLHDSGFKLVQKKFIS